MTRCAASDRVFFWEEPVFGDSSSSLKVVDAESGLKVAVPQLPSGLSEPEIWRMQGELLRDLIGRYRIKDCILWYYTPLALHFSRDIPAKAVVYDCMDELSAFRGAPQGLCTAESELFRRADLVFTGGKSLYEGKKLRHPSVHCFPSSIEREFFSTARRIRTEVPDQSHIPHPRLGFCGVIDERMDLELVDSIAESRPDWQFVMLGPVVKIGSSDLPRKHNLHYLGQKEYRLLPAYFAGWDAGLLPFALNESTRFISPTKTPEYLAAGLPVVSTPITDVVDPYGNGGFVHIAKTPQEFVAAAEKAIASKNSRERLDRVDQYLRNTSWDLTWKRMAHLLENFANNGKTERKHETLVGGDELNGELECSTI